MGNELEIKLVKSVIVMYLKVIGIYISYALQLAGKSRHDLYL